jgi:2-iminobutanoate/2-iminopropanoate deaminase
METIATDKAPKAVGPYAQAQKAGNLLFCSGQIGLDPETAKLAGDDIESQAKQVFKNMSAVLEGAGLSLNNVAKTTVFLKNIGDFPVVNGLYAEAFGDHKPARAAIGVDSLPLNALIMVGCIAVFE